MTVALHVTPGLRDHLEQSEQNSDEVTLVCMRGRTLTQLSTIIPPGELYRGAGHTIPAPDGAHLVDGCALLAGDACIRTWPHGAVTLMGPGWKRRPDTITYTFNVELQA